MSAMAVTRPSLQNPSLEEQTLAQLCHYETLNNHEKPCASCVISQILQTLIQYTDFCLKRRDVLPQNTEYNEKKKFKKVLNSNKLPVRSTH